MYTSNGNKEEEEEEEKIHICLFCLDSMNTSWWWIDID